MGVRARVTVNARELVPSLMLALAHSNCLVSQLDGTSCSVTVLGSEGRDDALLELRFFVRAWTASRPGATAAVIG